MSISPSGLSTLLNSQTGMTSTPSGSDMVPSPDPNLIAHAHASPKTTSVSSTPLTRGSAPQRPGPLQSSQSSNIVQTRDLQKEVEKEKVEPGSIPSSLDSKIDSFLQVNPGLRGLSVGFPSVFPWSKTVDSPSTSTENLGGTPVRDEPGATPTQDEVTDDSVVPFMYQSGSLQTAPATASLANNSAPPVESGPSVGTYNNDPWQGPNMHGSQLGLGPQNGGKMYQRNSIEKQEFGGPIRSPAEIGAGHNRVESLVPSSMVSHNQLSTERAKTVERTGLITQGAKSYSISGKTGDNAGLPDDDWYGKTYGGIQTQQHAASSETYGREPYHSEEPKPVLSPTSDFFNSQLPPLPPIPQLPPPPQTFLASTGGGVKDPVNLLGPVDEVQASRDVPEYAEENPAGYDDYNENAPHQIQANEPFRGHLNVSGPRHQAPRCVPPGPQNGPVDYNLRPRIPVHPQRHPSMPHTRPGPPSAVRGYHEAHSPPRSSSEEPYLDPYYNPHGSSPPSFNTNRPPSPQSHRYYTEGRDLPPHLPEHRPPPHHEHRPPVPHPYRAPHPVHYPPQRPLRRPPPPQMPYASEPPFQRGKRHGPPFAGPPRAGGVFYPPKRPFLPPRY